MNALDFKNPPILVAVTGASGSIYARRLCQVLKEMNFRVELVLSDAGEQVLRYEKEQALLDFADVIHNNQNYFAPPASGTSKYRGMVIVPCSMGTLGKVATGCSDSLLTRAADVFLKEKRPLLVVAREMPFNDIHLENMLRLSRAGATILPASPFFYYHPQNILDVVDTVVGKILDHLNIEHSLYKPWAQHEN